MEEAALRVDMEQAVLAMAPLEHTPQPALIPQTWLIRPILALTVILVSYSGL